MRPIAVHRFRLEIAGRTVCGLAFDDEAAMERFLLDRATVVVVDAPPAPSSPAPLAEPASRGRPSSRDAVLETVAAMPLSDFAGCISREDVAERVRARALEVFGDTGGLSTKSIIRHLGAKAAEILVQLVEGSDGQK